MNTLAVPLVWFASWVMGFGAWANDTGSGQTLLDRFAAEQSLANLMEVDGARMLKQAAQYQLMGTEQGTKSAGFLYREVLRRHPGTRQAEEASRRLDEIEARKYPFENYRFYRGPWRPRTFKSNPFRMIPDPEPDWIVPRFFREPDSAP